MVYTPTYDGDDISSITTDVVAKVFLAVGTLAAVVVLAIIFYMLFKRRR